MPCSSSHMEATGKEVAISQVACLLDELNGKAEIEPSHWRGYHPKVYGSLGGSYADALVSELCSRLQQVDVTTHSLEMQIWWRDHQKADKARLQKEIEAKQQGADREAALAKLSDYERRLLGLK